MADLYFFSRDCFVPRNDGKTNSSPSFLAAPSGRAERRVRNERSNPPKIIEFHPHSFLLHIMFITLCLRVLVSSCSQKISV